MGLRKGIGKKVAIGLLGTAVVGKGAYEAAQAAANTALFMATGTSETGLAKGAFSYAAKPSNYNRVKLDRDLKPGEDASLFKPAEYMHGARVVGGGLETADYKDPNGTRHKASYDDGYGQRSTSRSGGMDTHRKERYGLPGQFTPPQGSLVIGLSRRR